MLNLRNSFIQPRDVILNLKVIDVKSLLNQIISNASKIGNHQVSNAAKFILQQINTLNYQDHHNFSNRIDLREDSMDRVSNLEKFVSFAIYAHVLKSILTGRDELSTSKIKYIDGSKVGLYDMIFSYPTKIYYQVFDFRVELLKMLKAHDNFASFDLNTTYEISNNGRVVKINLFENLLISSVMYMHNFVPTNENLITTVFNHGYAQTQLNLLTELSKTSEERVAEICEIMHIDPRSVMPEDGYAISDAAYAAYLALAEGSGAGAGAGGYHPHHHTKEAAHTAMPHHAAVAHHPVAPYHHAPTSGAWGQTGAGAGAGGYHPHHHTKEAAHTAMPHHVAVAHHPVASHHHHAPTSGSWGQTGAGAGGYHTQHHTKEAAHTAMPHHVAVAHHPVAPHHHHAPTSGSWSQTGAGAGAAGYHPHHHTKEEAHTGMHHTAVAHHQVAPQHHTKEAAHTAMPHHVAVAHHPVASHHHHAHATSAPNHGLLAEPEHEYSHTLGGNSHDVPE